MPKKKITIDDLANMIQKGFQETARKEDMEKRFGDMEKRFGDMEKRFDGIEKKLQKLEINHEELKSEMRGLKYLLQQKAAVEDLNELDERLTLVERKLRKYETSAGK
ncbi:MAG: hypothetical protein WAP51_04475 [Candidatus Sungiibacteriota bacterium]